MVHTKAGGMASRLLLQIKRVARLRDFEIVWIACFEFLDLGYMCNLEKKHLLSFPNHTHSFFFYYSSLPRRNPGFPFDKPECDGAGCAMMYIMPQLIAYVFIITLQALLSALGKEKVWLCLCVRSLFFLNVCSCMCVVLV